MMLIACILTALVVAGAFVFYDRRKKPIEPRYHAKVQTEQGTLSLVLNDDQFATLKAWLSRTDGIDGLFEIESAGGYVAIFRRQVAAIEVVKR